MEPEVAVQAGLIDPHEGYQPAILEAWKKFTASQQLDPVVPPVIAASWRRCWGKVNPNHDLIFTRISDDYLLALQTASFNLIAIARPIMEDLYGCVQDSGTILFLTNGVGCILDLIGDERMVRYMEDWGCGLGSILSEELIGTTAFGLALTERMPVQVAGAEHFVQQLHSVTGASAPIFDMNGHLMGMVGLIMPVGLYHAHSLGLVLAAARAIESQHQSDLLMTEQNSQLTQLNTILSTISDGILVWRADYVLIHANQAASQILGLPDKSFLGKRVDTLVTIPNFVRKAVLRRKALTDVEGTVNIGGRNINCLISLDFVFQSQNSLHWIIMTLRPEKKVRMLVQRQMGANAVLTLDDIPGESPQMQRVRNFVKSAGGAQASILIRGEVGTGKNALASAVHNAGPCSEGPFVIFACSSVPNELVVSELLGYEESSETKRIGGRPSKFELAKGGTLFFQDVDALPLEAQAVLLNALELGVVQRLGSRRAIQIDSRVIASTSANIENLISQGAFRPDLYYRLSTFTIALPPLRERPRDIPLVVERILTRLSQQLGYHILLAPGVMEILKKYPWPGNIREVESVLGRAAIQASMTDGRIELAYIPSHVRTVHILGPNPGVVPSVNSLEEVERETILRVAQACRGNVTRMADVLGIGRTTLWRKLKCLAIDPDEYRRH